MEESNELTTAYGVAIPISAIVQLIKDDANSYDTSVYCDFLVKIEVSPTIYFTSHLISNFSFIFFTSSILIVKRY